MVKHVILWQLKEDAASAMENGLLAGEMAVFALTEHQPDEIASYESQATSDKQLHLNHNEISELSPTMNLLPLGRAIPS